MYNVEKTKEIRTAYKNRAYAALWQAEQCREQMKNPKKALRHRKLWNYAMLRLRNELNMATNYVAMV